MCATGRLSGSVGRHRTPDRAGSSFLPSGSQLDCVAQDIVLENASPVA